MLYDVTRVFGRFLHKDFKLRASEFPDFRRWFRVLGSMLTAEKCAHRYGLTGHVVALGIRHLGFRVYCV